MSFTYNTEFKNSKRKDLRIFGKNEKSIIISSLTVSFVETMTAELTELFVNQNSRRKGYDQKFFNMQLTQ